MPLDDSIRVRLGEGLRAEVDQQAALENRAMSKLIRQAVVEYLDREARTDDDVTVERALRAVYEELWDFRAESARIGGNLNQIALVFNQTGRVDNDNLEDAHLELQEHFREMMLLLGKIEKRLKDKIFRE